MNYIAHIHIAEHTNTSKLGGFLGDFVKGSDLSHLSQELELGIRLHRHVDTFTDTHSIILNLKQKFPTELRRMAGVIIDIYFDHLLMTHWEKFSEQTFHSLFTQFYAELNTFSLPKNQHYTLQSQRLISHQWLKEYQREQTCFRAFTSIEKRLKGKIQFAQQAQDFVIQNRKEMADSFQQFYPELLKHGLHLINTNKSLRNDSRDS